MARVDDLEHAGKQPKEVEFVKESTDNPTLWRWHLSEFAGEDLQNHLGDMDPELLFADGFEAALMGYVEIFNKVVALYDKDKCISILVARDGMTADEAEEYFSFNVQGAYMGEKTPAFATIMRRPDE